MSTETTTEQGRSCYCKWYVDANCNGYTYDLMARLRMGPCKCQCHAEVSK